MQFFNKVTNIDFMGHRRLAVGASLLAIVISIVSLATRGLEFGVDFTGGVLLEVVYGEDADLEQVRTTLEKGGFPDSRAQYYGSARFVLIRTMLVPGEDEARQGEKMLAALRAVNPNVELRRVEFVGPQVGEELRTQGALAMLFALLGILLYVALRFKWKFALGALAATVHDAVFVLGFFSVFGYGFDLTVLAAVLAVIGYSVNDTVVVFDRIRENFHKIRKSTPEFIMNVSINETLSRTIMTSFVTLIVVVAMFLVGGEVIHNFALALIVGIVVGTFSSIYVASALALWLKVTPADILETPQKERAEIDALP